MWNLSAFLAGKLERVAMKLNEMNIQMIWRSLEIFGAPWFPVFYVNPDWLESVIFPNLLIMGKIVPGLVRNLGKEVW